MALATFAAAVLAKKKHAARLLKRQGVHGVGIGFLDPRHPHKGAALVLYATTISATGAAAASSKLKLTVNVKGKSVQVPVRTVNAGPFHSHAADYTGKIRPVPAGYSIGTKEVSGTLGLILTHVTHKNSRYMFSNTHVLNPNNSDTPRETLQPGGADGGRPGQDRIGSLYRYVQLNKNQDNFLDAALSLPVRRGLLAPRYAAIGVLPGHVSSYRLGEKFIKVGRTTGLVKGTVESVHTDIQVDYGEDLGVLTFKNQSVIKGVNPISLPGDSGSVWLRSRDHYAAAVNFAGSSDGRLSIAFPVQWVMQVFRTRVARPTGAGTVKKAAPGLPQSAYTRLLTNQELSRVRLRTISS